MTSPGTDPSPHSPTGPDIPPHRYTAALASEIESAWQERWAREGTFVQPNPGEPGFDPSRPKRFVLDMFPYPSGVGLHVGHPLGYIATDVVARYLRMTGHNVLHAMGYDAFGLPAEQFAVQTGTHPRITTERNIATMRAQMRRLGLGHDPGRSVSTAHPRYYRWTQWIFLRLHGSWYDEAAGRARPIEDLVRALERGEVATRSGRAWGALSEDERREELDSRRLAYVAEVPVNWCPRLGTVLANEEVTAEGRSERGNFPVFRRPMRQWMLRITAYAERLVRDLDGLDWPEPIRQMQRNWIGRSEGAYVRFRVDDGKRRGVGGGECAIDVFTTRPDTLFGATYMVLSPEHPLVDAITPDAWPEGAAFSRGLFPGFEPSMPPRQAVAACRALAQARSDVQRQESREKTGVFTGAFAINPGTGERIPVFIADYVLMGYGTGAIMAVPAHDERDFEFALAFSLPVRDVVYTRAEQAMAWFARHAAEAERAPGAWAGALADFLELVTTRHAGEAEFAGLMDLVRRRRAAGSSRARSPDRRGAARAAWRDTLDALKIRSFDELARRFGSMTHHLGGGAAYSGPGFAANSSNGEISLDGLPTGDAKHAIIAWLERAGAGRGAVTYRLRDWLFSRQRYWGEPFPVVHDEAGRIYALPESMLPVELPILEDFTPEGSDDADAPPRPPLARARDWVHVTLDLGDGPRRYARETNTMPNWAGSCWYYLRYLDPENDDSLCAPEVERYWMTGTGDGETERRRDEGRAGGVDLYVGGVEHAVLHLLYARFWHKVLYDLGIVSTPEPFRRLFNQGYIQAAAYVDERGVYVEASEVEERDGGYFHRGRPVTRQMGKMGKSLRNAVAPDDVCALYGCDTLRVYEMSMGPLEASKPWNPRDIVGAFRFLQRAWRSVIDEQTGRARVVDAEPGAETVRLLHRTILGVRRDIQSLALNTAVSKLIELASHLSALPAVPRQAAEPFVLLLAPYAPHAAEEMWRRLGHAESLARALFPAGDAALASDEQVEVPVQVMGKVRSRVLVPAGADAAEHERLARGDERIRALLQGATVRKVVVVPGRMVNFVLDGARAT
jgi:leucyl-tRNA synthetase